MTGKPGSVPSLVTDALTSMCFTLKINYPFLFFFLFLNGYNNISTLHEHAGQIITTEEGEVFRHGSD